MHYFGDLWVVCSTNDGLAITCDGAYDTEKEAKSALKDEAKRLVDDGYESSVKEASQSLEVMTMADFMERQG